MLVAGQPVRSGADAGVIHNALSRFHDEIRAAARAVAAERDVQPVVPLEPADRFTEFTDATDIGLTRVEPHTYVLDLMRNPGARTTKTMASLLMVARAAGHTRRTGERVMILTPTSGNKGTALRDAVARAYATGITTPADLRVVTVNPEASRGKLRDCPLTADAGLRAANPVALARVAEPGDVKAVTARVAREEAGALFEATGFRLWPTLDLDNYRIADAARAFAEAELLPLTEDSPPRLHAHAVSSAFGLLGYHLGHEMLARGLPGRAVPARHPGFWLVQQLATPDMVTAVLGADVPDYACDPGGAVWRQEGAPHFPAETDDPREVVDSTFYTRAPATIPQVNAIIGRHGGGGGIVSRRECLARFDRVRALAAEAGIAIGADPAEIREWSLVKALTGVLVARERGLIAPGTDVVVHASGHYTDASLAPARDEHLTPIGGADDLARLVRAAAR
ncbi:DUF6002 family protein [Actinomadura sp. NEAU-AAG7]|uniref:DUF6002 family protein n=1 Tax=Actinomadura sp. NEAU-AAG7 TaxID=2839640 RepID=UPI001BE3E191|nr:DUF6002 family protein [Actinomadura sp. NEAU-AAG7]MBT2210897.1 hypothetical protein [Actinomadura sp. NEAU-AAG7]